VGIYARGVAMGVAELIPGVSGGTIAFITGIYQHLLESIRRFDGKAFRLLWQSGPRAFWAYVDLSFLLVLVAGMVTSVALLASLLRKLLEAYPVLVWSFFFGLILASVVFVARRVDRWNVDTIVAGVLGLLVGGLATQLVPVELEPGPFAIFASGSVAVCAWLLPGVSGSFVLLLLGMYGHLVSALVEWDLTFLGLMAAGCVIGLALFARMLAWALRSFPAPSLAALTGFMLGAVTKLWPWQQTLTYYLNADGEAVPLRALPVTPLHFQELTGEEPLVLGAVTLMCIGIAVVVLLDWLGSRRGASEH
jgi:putative membrane protein